MNKRLPSIILVIISIASIIFILSIERTKESNSVCFDELCFSVDDIDIIKSKRKHLKTNNVNIFFDGNQLFYDNINNVYYYSLVKNSKTANNPKISIIDNRFNIAIENCTINDNLIENSSFISIILYDDNYYFDSKIICTTLPMMNIYVDRNAVDFSQNLRLEEDVKESDMKLHLFDNVRNIFSRYNGKFSIRGKASSLYPKKGYKLSIENKEVEDNKQSRVSLLGLPEGNNFVLYAGYNDIERVRNVFCSQLWYNACAKDNSFGIDNGCYYEYVELFINNEYWGLYAVGYPINSEQEKIDNASINENIYKKISWSNEYNMNNNGDFTSGYELKTNKTFDEAWLPLINYYNVILGDDNSRIYDAIDLNNSIDIYIFYYLIQGTDHVNRDSAKDLLLYNTYLISKEKNGKQVMLYYPWDFDRTFGKGFGDDPIYNYTYDKNFIMEINPVYLLMKNGDKKIGELIKNKYEFLREGEWSDDKVNILIDNYEYAIFDSGAYKRDIEKWPGSSTEEIELKLNIFRQYVINRLHYCDENIENIIKAN